MEFVKVYVDLSKFGKMANVIVFLDLYSIKLVVFHAQQIQYLMLNKLHVNVQTLLKFMELMKIFVYHVLQILFQIQLKQLVIVLISILYKMEFVWIIVVNIHLIHLQHNHANAIQVIHFQMVFVSKYVQQTKFGMVPLASAPLVIFYTMDNVDLAQLIHYLILNKLHVNVILLQKYSMKILIHVIHALLIHILMAINLTVSVM